MRDSETIEIAIVLTVPCGIQLDETNAGLWMRHNFAFAEDGIRKSLPADKADLVKFKWRLEIEEKTDG